MAKRTKGPRRRTRKKMRKSPRDKTTVNMFLEEFVNGENVLIKIEPSSHRSSPHPRFKGKAGIVAGRRGRAYLVEVRDGGLKKVVLTAPEHLRHLNK